MTPPFFASVDGTPRARPRHARPSWEAAGDETLHAPVPFPGSRPGPPTRRLTGRRTLSVPPVQMIVIVTLAAVTGMVAAVGPARRAAKLDILDAIACH